MALPGVCFAARYGQGQTSPRDRCEGTGHTGVRRTPLRCTPVRSYPADPAVGSPTLLVRVGIAAPSIYSHFADRQAILVAIVRDAFGELREELLAAGEVVPTGISMTGA